MPSCHEAAPVAAYRMPCSARLPPVLPLLTAAWCVGQCWQLRRLQQGLNQKCLPWTRHTNNAPWATCSCCAAVNAHVADLQPTRAALCVTTPSCSACSAVQSWVVVRLVLLLPPGRWLLDRKPGRGAPEVLQGCFGHSPSIREATDTSPSLAPSTKARTAAAPHTAPGASHDRAGVGGGPHHKCMRPLSLLPHILLLLIKHDAHARELCGNSGCGRRARRLLLQLPHSGAGTAPRHWLEPAVQLAW